MTGGFLARSRRTGSDNGGIRQVLRTSAQDVRRSAKDVLILLRHVFGAWRERGYPGAAAELSPATTIEGYLPLHCAVVPGCLTSNLRLFVRHHVQQGTVNFNVAVIVNQA